MLKKTLISDKCYLLSPDHILRVALSEAEGQVVTGKGQECLEGLKFVHELRLIHCDLKPENILIRSYSRCEIKIIGLPQSPPLG